MKRRPGHIASAAGGEAPGLMTVKAFCQRLSISRRTLERWRSRWNFPEVVRLPGGTIRIPDSELERVINGEFTAMVEGDR